MDKVLIGSVVRSKCGRDRKRVFVIVDVCCDTTGRVLVCDGKLHPLSKPKKKNLRHLAVLAAADNEVTSFHQGGDSELKRFLEDFEKGLLEKSCTN